MRHSLKTHALEATLSRPLRHFKPNPSKNKLVQSNVGKAEEATVTLRLKRWEIPKSWNEKGGEMGGWYTDKQHQQPGAKTGIQAI